MAAVVEAELEFKVDTEVEVLFVYIRDERVCVAYAGLPKKSKTLT